MDRRPPGTDGPPLARGPGTPGTPEPAQPGPAAHLEELLDEALIETFPCSDPISTLHDDSAGGTRRGL